MKAIVEDKLIEKYDLDFGTYYFYDQYIIAEINEGEVITLRKCQDLIPIVQKHYGNVKSFTYISDRIYSHSIIPTDYLNCPFIYMDNFKGYGVVTYNLISTISTEIEKHFAQRSFRNFDNLKGAIDWAKNEADD